MCKMTEVMNGRVAVGSLLAGEPYGTLSKKSVLQLESNPTCGESTQAEGRCDACPNCYDVCDIQGCLNCLRKAHCVLKEIQGVKKGERIFTECEVRRHKSKESCWIVVERTVYDCTEFLRQHPGGINCIVKRSGGQDCSRDMAFHSKAARKLLQSFKMGRLVECGSVEHVSSCQRCLPTRAECTIM